MSAQLTSGLSVEFLLQVINVKYGYFTLLYFLYVALPLVYLPLANNTASYAG